MSGKYPKRWISGRSLVLYSHLMVKMVYLFFADAKVQTAGLSSSWLAIFKCRRGSAVTLLGISKCRRGSADRGWLFLSADAKVQTLALSLSSLDYAHISSSDTFRFWNWALASSKTQSDKPEVTLLSKNDEDKIVIVLIVTPQPNQINIFGKSKATNGLGTFMGSQVSKRCVEVWTAAKKALRWNVLFFFDAHAVLFTVRILGASSYETRRANATALILVFIGLVLGP